MGDLWRSIGLTSGARIYSVAAGTVSLIITARVLGPEGRGTIATAVTWSLLFATVGYLSLGQVALHRATGKDPSEWLGRTLAALLAMAAAVTAVGWIAAVILYEATGGRVYGHAPRYAVALGFVTLPFLVWEQYGSNLLMALGRMNVYNRAEIVGRSAGVALVVLLVAVARAGVAGALCALLAAQAIVAATGLRYLLRRAGGTLSLTRSTLQDLVSGGLKLHLNTLGAFLFTNAAVLIVQYLRGPAETGSFQVVVQLMTVALLVPYAAAMVLFGEAAQRGPDAAWPAQRRVLLSLLPLVLGLAVAGSLAAPWLIPLVLGDDFRNAVGVFQIMSFGLVGQTLAIVMAPQWIARGLFWQASALTVALGLVNLGTCFALVDAYGMEGAAVSILGVSLVSLLGNGAMALWVERRVAQARPVMAREGSSTS